MYSIRKWFSRPKREDASLLAQFYWADEELNMVAAELDSFDGRKDPERCSALVNQLRICQDKVLELCNKIMDDAIFSVRANRDFRAKFPDDILQENLAGQLWFGAECLAAGSNIMNRELESASMRPLAKALTRALDNVRFLLREQCLRNSNEYSEKVKEGLVIFDRLFSDFELCYVSAMVPVKSAREYHLQQEVIVLFSETLYRALKLGLVTQEMVDDCDPSLMFTIPRLAIVCGLLVFSDGPLNVNQKSSEMSELFRPFYSLLCKIRDLLWTLTNEELHILEKTLCSLEEPEVTLTHYQQKENCPTENAHYVNFFYRTHQNCKQFIQDFYTYNFGIIKPQEAFLNSHITKASSEENVLEESGRRLHKSSKCKAPQQELSHSLPEHGSPAKQSPLKKLQKEETSLCSSCLSNCSLSSCDWDLRSLENTIYEYSISSCQSTETSSYTSECQDDEEIALALQAAEIATCNKARACFKNSTDLIHRLFVCVSGVADQLQTNYASDLRNILKCVFEMSSSNPQLNSHPFEIPTPNFTAEEEIVQDQENVDVAEEAVDTISENQEDIDFEDPPEWIPDELADQCMACKTAFTLLRRRHHCRNCGKIFCARCSSNSIPLPRYGHLKAVRVCNTCFVQQVTEVLVRQQC